jgi:hypothetical protein
MLSLRFPGFAPFTYKSRTETKISMVDWWIDTEKGKLERERERERERENLSQCKSVHHKSQIEWPGIELWPPRREFAG